eukprot:360854-Chlamydomonas_euryale.AAC.2
MEGRADHSCLHTPDSHTKAVPRPTGDPASRGQGRTGTRQRLAEQVQDRDWQNRDKTETGRTGTRQRQAEQGQNRDGQNKDNTETSRTGMTGTTGKTGRTGTTHGWRRTWIQELQHVEREVAPCLGTCRRPWARLTYQASDTRHLRSPGRAWPTSRGRPSLHMLRARFTL